MTIPITMVYDQHLMLECVVCGFRLRLPLKDHSQVRYMYCANCDNSQSFTEAPWTEEEKLEGV